MGDGELDMDGRPHAVLVGFPAVGVRVVAVDVGSVGPPSRFAWVALDAHGPNQLVPVLILLRRSMPW
jgi:hypothetical protein